MDTAGSTTYEECLDVDSDEGSSDKDCDYTMNDISAELRTTPTTTTTPTTGPEVLSSGRLRNAFKAAFLRCDGKSSNIFVITKKNIKLPF